MKKIIDGWYHAPGRHCASTALRDVARFRGFDWDEALCFGLGRGLGAFYLESSSFSPSKWLMVRASGLEPNFFESLGIPFEWKQAQDAETAWEMTKEDINAGLPLLLHTDIYYMDYYNSKTHFNRHTVLMWGYDEEAGEAYLSDTERQGLMSISLESLSRARSSEYPPGPVKFDYYPVAKPEPAVGIEEAALEALKRGAFDMTGPGEGYPVRMGLPALEELARNLPHWRNAEDWQWSARFAYQVIEKRGTGGGAFRKMFAEFVRQVEDMHPRIKPLGLSRKMDEISIAWSELAAILKEISEKSEPEGFEEAAECAGRLHKMEKNYCETVLSGI